MADQEIKEVDSSTRGTDWEVVSLTSSAYAASPGPQTEEDEDSKHGGLESDQQDYAPALFMSNHFIFPPSEHENLPLLSDEILLTVGQTPENVDQESQHESVYNAEVNDKYDTELVVPMEMHNLVSGEGEAVRGTSEKCDSRRAERSVMHFSESDVLHGSPFFSEKETLLDDGLFQDAPERAEASQVVVSHSDAAKLSNQEGESKGDGSGLPCMAWWKRQAISLCSQMKEANSVWSILVAAALMGLVVLGHRWQQEKLHFQQLKWQFSIADEKLSRMITHVSRLKGALLGHHQTPVLRHTNSAG